MGGGRVTFHNSGHRLALGHVNNMRCLGIKDMHQQTTAEDSNLIYHRYMNQDEDGTMTDTQLKSVTITAICYHKIMAISDEDTWSC